MIIRRRFAALLALALHGLLHVQALSYARDHVPGYISRVDSIEFSSNPADVQTGSALQVELGFSDDTRKIRFQLRPNHNVVSRSLHLQHILSDGSSQALPPSSHAESQPSSLFFKGTAFVASEVGGGRWAEAGWARMSYRRRGDQHQLQGAFRLNGVTHHLATDSAYLKARRPTDPEIPEAHLPHLLVWTDSGPPDAAKGDFSVMGRSSGDEPFCGTEGHRVDARDVSPRQFSPQPFDPIDVIGSTEGCPTIRRVALLGVAADCTYTSDFQSLEDTRDHMISQINIASQIYEDNFNVSLVIQNLTISDASCPAEASPSTPWNVPCTQGFDISARLSSFSAWRGQFDDGNAIWTLMSACNTGQTVGIAWLGSVCSRGVRTQSPGGRTQSVASTNVVVRIQDEWQVIAHEIGHNFGATHDCTSQTCGSAATEECCPLSRSTCNADAQYIMNPITGSSIRDFSDCSIGTICTGMGRGVIDTTCFVSEEDAPDISQSECGNGIVEAGEACDCGGEEGCPSNSCCDPATCQLREDAQCDPTNDRCCTDSCRLSSRGQVCRDSTGSCDLEETCDGASAQCPEDVFEPDGESCGDGLRCASGQCTSRDLQCAIAYNETGATVEACNDNSCQLFCNIPGQGCSRSSSQNFLDGTQCGSGGTCRTGSCERPGSRGGPNDGDGNRGGGGGSAGDWLDRNRPVVIGVASGVGGLVVIIIVACMVSRFRQRNNAKRLSKRWPGSSPMVAQYVSGQRPPQLPTDRILYR